MSDSRNIDELSDARGKIDAVDRDLVRLLKQRMDAVESVGAYKQGHCGFVLDPKREEEVALAWADAADERGLSKFFTNRILQEILEHSRRSQEVNADAVSVETKRVGYQGAAMSYSDLAIQKLFAARGSDTQRTGYRTFACVFDALADGSVDYALVPVENSLVGGIHDVSDLILTREVTVVDEEIWPVSHCVAALPGVQPEDVRLVRSHPVALRQCRRQLELMRVDVVEVYDTAGAAVELRSEGRKDVAVICSEEAATASGLIVLRRDIADQQPNETRFLLLAVQAEHEARGVACKTTLSFAVDDRCGALAQCLMVFAQEGINLTRLESRPHPDAPWEYLFLADIEGHREDESLCAALRDIRPFVNNVRVLGTYPSRKDMRQDQAPAQISRPVPRPSAPVVRQEKTRPVSVSGVEIGSDRFTLIIGPCAVETAKQMQDAAALAKANGAHLLRGGAFKPRSSPRSFQGLGFPGLTLLRDAGHHHGLPIVTEALRPEDVPRIAAEADMIQVGARNMQNFALLSELGKTRCPILLKRGMSATVVELLQAAEYILDGGNQRVVLCERGIRTFETATRSTLDVSAVPVLKKMTDLPVIVDPSHAAGVRDLVVPLALAAAAVGADGLIVEAHPYPEEALCDKDQALTQTELAQLISGLGPVLESRGRYL